MKNIKTTIFHFILFSSLISFRCIAQISNCSEDYEKALKLYNYGMADSALSILNPCITDKSALKNLSKESGTNIFRLAALSSIMEEDPGAAEDYIRQLLKYQPDYKNNFREEDLMEFRVMVRKALALPALRFGITGGINFPFMKLQKKYSNYETSIGAGYSLQGSYGFQSGIAAEKLLTKNISIEVAAVITQILFKYTVNRSLFQQYQYDQSLSCIEIPVLARYYFSASKSFKPYLEGGISGTVSLNKMEKSDVYGRYWFTKSSNSDKILTTFLTDYEHFGLIFGGGIDYDLKNFNIRLDFIYNESFKNSGSYSKFDNISGYDDISHAEKFYYTDDINLISLKNIQISIGLLYNMSYKVF